MREPWTEEDKHGKVKFAIVQTVRASEESSKAERKKAGAGEMVVSWVGRSSLAWHSCHELA